MPLCQHHRHLLVSIRLVSPGKGPTTLPGPGADDASVSGRQRVEARLELLSDPGSGSSSQFSVHMDPELASWRTYNSPGLSMH